VLGEDKRGRERNSNDAIGQKSEHSKLVKDYTVIQCGAAKRGLFSKTFFGLF